MRNNIKKITPSIICITLCVLFCLFPLFNIFKTIDSHEGLFFLSRIELVCNAIKNFRIPTYLHCFETVVCADSIMYPSLFINIPAFLNIFINNVYICANIFKIIIIITSFLISYTSALYVLKDKVYASIFTILFNVNYYFLYNIFVRDAIGETLGIVFIPMLFAGIYSLYFDDNKYKYVYPIAHTCIMQSHIITFTYILIFLAVFNLINFRISFSKKVFVNVFKANSLVLLLNIWFIVPFVDYYLGTPHVSYHPELSFSPIISKLSDLVFLVFPSSAAAELNHYGIEHVIIYFTNLFLLIGLQKFKGDNKFNTNKYLLALICFVIFNLFLLFIFDNALLQLLLKIDWFKYIYSLQQFSFRVIGRTIIFLVISFTLSINVLIDIFIDKKNELYKIFILILVSIIVIFSNFGNMKRIVGLTEYLPDDFDPKQITLYDDYKILDTTSDKTKYYEASTEQDKKFEEVYGSKGVEIIDYTRKYLKINLEYEIHDFNEKDLYFIDLPWSNYKYFNAYIDEKRVDTYYGHKDRNIRIKVSGKQGKVRAVFEPPIFWIIAKWVSIFTIIIICRKQITELIKKVYNLVLKIKNKLNCDIFKKLKRQFINKFGRKNI